MFASATAGHDGTVSSSVPVKRLYRGELGRVNVEPTNRTFRTLVPGVHRLARILTQTPTWRGGERLPATGPAIIVPNHISSLDPVLVGEFLAYNGRWPHFLARANLFDLPVLGALLRDAEQIPVQRDGRQAGDALGEAARSLQAGQVIVIYPEGTITFDPDEWPMAAHTGAARLALASGAPVIPIGQWGASFALPPRKIRPFTLRRAAVTIDCGAPVDLSEFAGGADDRHAVRAASVRIMDAITAQVELARGAKAPTGRWQPRLKRRVPRIEAVS